MVQNPYRDTRLAAKAYPPCGREAGMEQETEPCRSFGRTLQTATPPRKPLCLWGKSFAPQFLEAWLSGEECLAAAGRDFPAVRNSDKRDSRLGRPFRTSGNTTGPGQSAFLRPRTPEQLRCRGGGQRSSRSSGSCFRKGAC